MSATSVETTPAKGTRRRVAHARVSGLLAPAGVPGAAVAAPCAGGPAGDVALEPLLAPSAPEPAVIVGTPSDRPEGAEVQPTTSDPGNPSAHRSRVGRLELRAERRQLRRQQRLYLILALAVIVGALAATVAVLDVVR